MARALSTGSGRCQPPPQLVGVTQSARSTRRRSPPQSASLSHEGGAHQPGRCRACLREVVCDRPNVLAPMREWRFAGEAFLATVFLGDVHRGDERVALFASGGPFIPASLSGPSEGTRVATTRSWQRETTCTSRQSRTRPSGRRRQELESLRRCAQQPSSRSPNHERDPFLKCSFLATMFLTLTWARPRWDPRCDRRTREHRTPGRAG